MNVETLIKFRTNFGYHSNQCCRRGNKNWHAMFTNKSHKFRNRRWPLFLSRLLEVLQQMPRYLKLSGRKSKTFVLERGVDFFTQQAPKSTASPCISCYRSPICYQINFFQKNLWSRGIERSGESLYIVKNDHLLFCKSIASLVSTSWIIQNIWEEIMCMRVNAMHTRCKWHSWAEKGRCAQNCTPMP